MDEWSRTQLKTIEDINAICTALSAPYWLRGGWAIDFLLGQVTRRHADIDIVTWIHHQTKLEQAFHEAGFEIRRVSNAQTDLQRGEVEISIIYLTRDEAGQIVTHSIPDWTWYADALSPCCHTLRGVSARTVNPLQLLEEKQTYEEGTGRPLRPKDLESIAVLRAIISNSLDEDAT